MKSGNKEFTTTYNRQLLEDPNVIFAGYLHPHPLETHIVVKVQTTEASDPWTAMHGAVRDLTREAEILQRSFQESLSKRRGHIDDHMHDY